ncbi:MAG: pilus assembly FimT family protein [Myxococcota bacterium]
MLRKFLQFPSYTTPWGRTRGFTLVELMAVVMLIALLALVAIPTASRAMRERRSSRAAHEIAMLFNQARSRAIARGSAVLVRYNYANGGFDVLEAIAGSEGATIGNCELAPATSCTVPAGRWNANGDNQLLTQFRPLNNTAYEHVDVEFHQKTYALGAVGAATPAAVDICIAPSGRAFYRPSNEGSVAFSAMTGNHAIKVWMHNGSERIGFERHVFILPNGTARVGI